MEKYNIPFYQKSNLKGYFKLLYAFCILSFAAVSIFGFVIMVKDGLFAGFIVGLFMLILCFNFAYILIFAGILKRFYIEMTSEYIEIAIPYKTRRVYWEEIYYAQLYMANKYSGMAILLNKDRNKKRSILSNFDSLVGVPQNSFQIPLNIFIDIDSERFLITMSEQLNKVDEKYIDSNENSIVSSEENSNSIIKAIVISLLLCFIMSLIYGFTIYKFNQNNVGIPIFGCFLIISGFNKYYIEKSFNMFIRLLIGLICLIQVPTAIICVIIMTEKISITLNYVLIIIKEYFGYLVTHPSKQIIIIIVAIICFIIGITIGRTNKKSDIMN